MKNKLGVIKNCLYCNKQFVLNTHNKKYCSVYCQGTHNDQINKEKKAKQKAIRYQERRKDPEFNKKRKQNHRKWVIKNREYSNQRSNKYILERRKRDPDFKIRGNLNSRVRKALKKNSKSNSTMELVGCSMEDLWKHLISNFSEKPHKIKKVFMSKKNHGLWHIDHIIPCSAFDLRCPVQQLACFHYTNLQPLWDYDNLEKGKKYKPTLERGKNKGR